MSLVAQARWALKSNRQAEFAALHESAFDPKRTLPVSFCCGASEIHIIRVTRAGIVNYLVAPSPEHLSVIYVVRLIVSARTIIRGNDADIYIQAAR